MGQTRNDGGGRGGEEGQGGGWEEESIGRWKERVGRGDGTEKEAERERGGVKMKMGRKSKDGK